MSARIAAARFRLREEQPYRVPLGALNVKATLKVKNMGENDQVIQLLGEIKGELKGINQVIHANHSSVQQRFDDMQKSIDQRFDSIEKRVEHVESEQKNIIWKVASWSSLGGAVVAGSVELMKVLAK